MPKRKDGPPNLRLIAGGRERADSFTPHQTHSKTPGLSPALTVDNAELLMLTDTEDIMEQLITRYLPLIHTTIRCVAPADIDEEALIPHALIGLHKAATAFIRNPDYGFTFLAKRQIETEINSYIETLGYKATEQD